MTLATKRTAGESEEYRLAHNGAWYWQSISDPNIHWGSYGSKGAAIAAARKAGFTVA